MGKFGVGLDLGTTTVQARLVNLESGEILDEISALNSQRVFGSDVMTRIASAREGKTEELFAAINGQTRGILRQFIEKYRLSKIDKCHVSGNTTMMHLFCGVNPGTMGEAPYTPVFLEERYFSGKELNLSADQILLLPGISSFVGADIVAGLAFSSILNKNESSLFADIGTNGEIAVLKKNGKKFFCTSTAAGPCFEGAEISCGMIAQAGAINRISLSKDESANWFAYNLPILPNAAQETLYYKTVDDEKARGICGSGLIDAVAVMKKLGVIEESGAFADSYAQTAFSVAENIGVNQADIRRFQLAKSAIYSGIAVLCKIAGISPASFDKAYVAGGLGFFIDLESAAFTGLLPREIISKTDACGNTSLKGAVQSLTDGSFLPRCHEIISRACVIDLAVDKEFSEAFTDNMII
ncbi:ASKHA domain-containing protein [Treponema sp. R6D11]